MSSRQGCGYLGDGQLAALSDVTKSILWYNKVLIGKIRSIDVLKRGDC